MLVCITFVNFSKSLKFRFRCFTVLDYPFQSVIKPIDITESVPVTDVFQAFAFCVWNVNSGKCFHRWHADSMQLLNRFQRIQSFILNQSLQIVSTGLGTPASLSKKLP